MNVRLDSTRSAMVDVEQPWLSMETCPIGTKVQLKGDGIASYGTWNGKETFWRAWAPLPKTMKDKNGEDYYPRDKEEWRRMEANR